MLNRRARKAGVETSITPRVLRNSFARHELQQDPCQLRLTRLLGLQHYSSADRYLRAFPHALQAEHARTHPRGAGPT